MRYSPIQTRRVRILIAYSHIAATQVWFSLCRPCIAHAIPYLYSAHHVALSKQHKSISASDVIKALELIELGDLADKLQEELVSQCLLVLSCRVYADIHPFEVYRELAKTDKSKKGTSNISAPKNRSVSSASTAGGPSTVSKGKGKEKASAEPAPFSSAPLPHPGYLNESASTGPGMAMDVDGYDDLPEDEFAGDVNYDVEGEMDPEGAEGIEDEVEADEEEEEEPDEDEELVDTVALEEEEVRKDARGLDDPVQPADVVVDHDMES